MMDKKYTIIYADPPWDYDSFGKRHKGKSPRKLWQEHYNLMTKEELDALPVANLADTNCHLYLWTTNAFMYEAHQLAIHWGFRPITIITWVKDRFGLGWYFRNQTEHMIFGVKGSLPTTNRLPTFFNAKRTRHSAKPQEARDFIEKASSYEPRIELFAREKHEGWDVWGNEVESDITM